ncbi:MAG: ROK family protein [Clostridia bacterium]|nr:ROK family protein [Clostridia bacterium]
MKEKKYYVGIDIGGTFVKCGIVSSQGEIIVKGKIPTGKDRTYQEIAQDIANFVRELEKQAGVQTQAVGIGCPGTVDSDKGIIMYSNNIAWENIPLGKELEKLLGKPTYITNDANAAALGESFIGAGKAYNSSILITLGTGVGGGIVLDGKLFEGNCSAGAEIGHHVIRKNGKKCTCGRRGCFEAYSSATALMKEARQQMKKNKSSMLWEACNGKAENVDGKVIFDCAKAGDETAKKVVDWYIDYLSEGIANLANVFRPEAILLGGGVSAQGDALIVPTQKLVNERLYGGSEYAPVKVAVATLGNDAGLCGAGKLAMQEE